MNKLNGGSDLALLFGVFLFNIYACTYMYNNMD